MLVKVKIFYYKSRGGRCTGMRSKIVPALVIMWQTDHTCVVELQEAAFNMPKGYTIAVSPSKIIYE